MNRPSRAEREKPRCTEFAVIDREGNYRKHADIETAFYQRKLVDGSIIGRKLGTWVPLQLHMGKHAQRDAARVCAALNRLVLTSAPSAGVA